MNSNNDHFPYKFNTFRSGEIGSVPYIVNGLKNKKKKLQNGLAGKKIRDCGNMTERYFIPTENMERNKSTSRIELEVKAHIRIQP
jgi:hypothetical protein